MRATRAAGSLSETSTRLGTVAAVVVIGALQFAIALAAARRPAEALVIVAGIVLVTSAVVFPRIVLVAALVATMFAQRVGPASLNLSVTDAVSVLGVLAAIRFVPWSDRRVRLVMGGLLIYLGTLAVSLIPNHPQRSVLELFHQGVLFGGSIMIGIAIVRSGSTRIALRAFMVLMTALATAACLEALRNGFEPAYVFRLQKNHAGLLLAVAFLVAYTAGRQLAWSRRTLLVLRVLTLLGLLATQSRAAALGLAAALAVRPLLMGRRGNQRAASIGVLVLCLALLGLSAASINANELNRDPGSEQFNSINTRTSVYRDALRIWKQSPVTGEGLRYFVDPVWNTIAPHNLVVGQLAETGVIGLAGLVVLLGATAMALRRSTAGLAMLGMLVLVLRVTQGLAEIFWVAGPLTVVLILVGMGLVRAPDEPEPSTPDRATLRGRTGSRLLPQGWLS